MWGMGSGRETACEFRIHRNIPPPPRSLELTENSSTPAAAAAAANFFSPIMIDQAKNIRQPVELEAHRWAGDGLPHLVYPVDKSLRDFV